MKLFQDFIQTFRPPSVEELAVRELQDARRKLLEAQSGRDYAEAMCAYHAARIERLDAQVNGGVAKVGV